MNGQSLSDSTVSAGDIRTSVREASTAGTLRPWVWIGISVFAVCGIGAAIWLWAAGSEGAGDYGPTARVVRSSMLVTLTESGEVEAAKKKVIRNELPWPVVIKKVIPEGQVAQPEEPVIVFECRQLEDAMYKQKLAVRSAESELEEAKANLNLQQRDLDHEVTKAEQAVKDAEIDLVRYKEGEYPNSRREATREIALADQDLALAEKKLKFKKDANADESLNSPYSENEIKADELSVARLRLSLENAKNKKEMLEKYDHPRELRRLKMAVQDADLELDRTKYRREVELRKARDAVDLRDAEWKDKRAELERQLEYERKLTITLDEPGLVVYDTGGHRWSSDDVVVDVGEEIRPKQQLMIIPDMSTLQVKTQVYESDIAKLREGLKREGGIQAYVRFHAMPRETFKGRVSEVSVLASSKHRWLYPNVKVFDVIVKLDGRPDALKPNWQAQVELEVDRLADAVQVPIAAVFTEQDRRYVWRVGSSGPKDVDVELGKKNATKVQIVEGLNVGDEVLLAPPEEGTAREEKGTGEGPPMTAAGP